MFRWAILFLSIGLISAFSGFWEVAHLASNAAKLLCFGFFGAPEISFDVRNERIRRRGYLIQTKGR